MSVRVYLVRHGESVGNATGQRLYNPDLTARGWRQSQALARRLAAAGCDRVVASPLIRALQTATCLASLLTVPIHVCNDLAEYNRWDAYQGAGWAELARRFPTAVLETAMPSAGWRYPGAEGLAAVRTRAGAVAARLAAVPDGARVAVVAHGNFNAVLLRHWMGAGPGWGIVQDNACVNLVVLDGDRVLLETVNDTSHLPCFGMGAQTARRFGRIRHGPRRT